MRLSPALLLLAAAPLTACSWSPFRLTPRVQRASFFTPPAQLLADKETDVAGIVTVKRVETRWVILPDGDHVALHLTECEMDDLLRGAEQWHGRASQTVMQFEYSDMISEPIAPPAIEGRRYVLWAFASSADSEVPPEAPWTAHSQGLLLIRGRGDREFVFWGGKSYLVSALRDAIRRGDRVPLDQIVDPVRRLRVAEDRMRRGALGDEKAFIRGLLVNVLDAEGQAKLVEREPRAERGADTLGIRESEANPHALWYRSVALLRDLGRDERYRKDVVAALEPVVRTARERIRLASALALVDLGSDAGRAALISGFGSDSERVSTDPPDQAFFPGRYPYDDSTAKACAHALARLGDRRGLGHPKPEVRLAAAEALTDRADPELRRMLEDLARHLEAEVARQRSRGELTKPRKPGDLTNRYPANWVQAHGLLARMGDDRSLRRLVDAYLLDAGTFPREEAPLVPAGRPVMWSDGPSLGAAIRGADPDSKRVLDRLATLYKNDPRWDRPPLRVLRASLTGHPAETPATPPPAADGIDDAQIAKRLASRDPRERAEGLAAAGYHQRGEFYDQVVEVALRGEGIERNAAIYALGWYRTEVPEATLRQLMSAPDPDVRLSALELASRRDPGRFAEDAINVLHACADDAEKGGAGDANAQQRLRYLTRILSRFSRGPLPGPLLAGLEDREAAVRRVVAESLGMGGNPEVVPHLERLAHDPDASVRDVARAAIDLLGPADSS